MASQNINGAKALVFEQRIALAFQMKFQPCYGLVSRLAAEAGASRKFLYENSRKFDACFTQADEGEGVAAAACCLNDAGVFLSLRMEGRCSIAAASAISERLGLPHTSVGYISQVLKCIGEKLGHALPPGSTPNGLIYICFDEIYTNRRLPILISACPISFAIINIQIADDRTAETWRAHMHFIVAQDISVSKTISDEAPGIKSAAALEMPGADRQSDTFHAVAHRLGLLASRYERHAFSCIGKEYRQEGRLISSKSEAQKTKRAALLAALQEKSKEAIERHGNFKFLYGCMLSCFCCFSSSGRLKDKEKAQADFKAALSLIKTLEDSKINEQAASIENCIPTLFTHFDTARLAVGSLIGSVGPFIAEQFSCAWQYRKNAVKIKSKELKKAYFAKEQEVLGIMAELMGADFHAVKDDAYSRLSMAVQSSAAVECINSILRPYLDSCKGSVSQEFLNLFMFYHNNRRFADGERKGRTPMEILRQEPNPEDWVAMALRCCA